MSEQPTPGPAVTYSLDGRVATIRLTDPRGRNALHHDSLAALLEAVERARADGAAVERRVERTVESQSSSGLGAGFGLR